MATVYKAPTKFQVLLHEKQAEFLASTARFRAFCGGRGAGKTVTGTLSLLYDASSKRDRLYMVVAPNFGVMRDSSLRTFLKFARRLGRLVGYNKTEWRATLDSGSQIVFKSAEEPDSLRGPSISGLWIDEAQGVPIEAYSIATGCLREDPVYNWCNATFTPQGKLHWTYQIFAKPDENGNLPPDTVLIHCPTWNNPFLPDVFATDLGRQYTTRMAEQELGGEFLDIGGVMFKREWFANKIVSQIPRDQVKGRVRYWDRAASDKTSACYTAGVLMTATYDGRFFVENMVRGQWTTFQRNEIMKLTAELDRVKYGYGSVRVYIEQEPGSSGIDSVRQNIHDLPGHIVYGDKVTGDKRTRAEGFAARCEAGDVFLVDDPSTPEYIPNLIEELVRFPTAKLCDQVDACSGAFNQLARGVYSMPVSDSGGSGGAPAASVPQAQNQLLGAMGRLGRMPATGMIGGGFQGGLRGPGGGGLRTGGGGGLR